MTAPAPNEDQQEWYSTHLAPHETLVRRWLQSRYGQNIEAEDIVQEALMRVLTENRKTRVAAPKAYFFAIARNLAVDRMRKNKIRASESLWDEEALEVLDEAPSVEETVARTHELEILTKAIQQLPERCLRVFTLAKVYGMSHQEISDELGISVNTVSNQIGIGLAKCARFMNRHGLDRV